MVFGWRRLPVQRSTMATTTPLAQVRISARECDAIRRATAKACGETGAVWRRVVLFGSRTDPLRRGGDVDLLLEIVADPRVDAYRLKQRLQLALEDELGPQRFDLVVDDRTAPGAFVDLVRDQGVELWSNN